MKINILLIAVIMAIVLTICFLFSGFFQELPVEKEIIPLPPSLSPPNPVVLPELIERHENEKINISENINASLFENCTLEIYGIDGMKISNCKFINSKICIYEGSRNIEISNNVITDYYVHESAVIGAYNCENLLINHNEIENNSIGIAIIRGGDIEISNNTFNANDQHNSLLLDSVRGANVHNNSFRYNYPHAILILNREGNHDVWVDIYNNTLDRNIEDAINFEDFRDSERVSRVYNNRITGTGHAGINVEYNSWNANIIIDNNYIDNNGLLIEDILDNEGHPMSIYPAHEHQPEPYCPGWKHGIKLEDCSKIIVKNNVIVNNSGNGVDIKNCQNITLEANLISKNAIGISIMKFQESSFNRDVSPLATENAGYSEVIAIENSVFVNREQDYFVEEGSTLEKVGAECRY